MLVDKNSITPQIDNAIAKQKNFLEVFLSQICGECKQLSQLMLNSLLVLVIESDWALSTILQVNYITPLELYCEQTQPCDVPIAFPKLLILIGKLSEDELDRICESSIPSFFLKWMISISAKKMIAEIANCLLLWTSTPRSYSAFLAHNFTQFLVFLNIFKSSESSFPHLPILTQLCFSPHLEVSKLALKALSTRCKSNPESRSYIRTLKVPSSSTDSSSELVPFAGRLCSTLAEHVSEMKSLFAESSPSDGTISALSTTLPDKSSLLSGNTVLELLCEELSFLHSLLFHIDNAFQEILIKYDFAPLLKSTIIACLDLLEPQKIESNSHPAFRTDYLFKSLNISWSCAASCLYAGRESLRRAVESTFPDVPQLCSLLERTCCLSSPTHHSCIGMIVNIGEYLPRLIPFLLEENLVERVINASNPNAVPTTHAQFHQSLVWAIKNFIRSLKHLTEDKFEQKRIRMLQFERSLKTAKQYLQFILQREEFIPNEVSRDHDLPSIVTELVVRIFKFEHELFKDGEIVETGREEWEVGWLVEKTKEKDLKMRLEMIREDDVRMKKNEKERWKKRVERLREAGHEDVMEGWLTRMENTARYQIMKYVKRVNEESGMNVRFSG
ncbi:hypothetical protein BLNAU_5872 [Blattamonas nauphoetae]|uniref:Uncharacterized protein n=1 Tax=Blattamonas nauphoetae TaxID=2049346 RepID=A0ABQ9Y5R3_9EUKA|nr:hypothetical protein BLNAU_5872 [Blattamonas nauphoetae]